MCLLVLLTQFLEKVIPLAVYMLQVEAHIGNSLSSPGPANGSRCL